MEKVCDNVVYEMTGISENKLKYLQGILEITQKQSLAIDSEDVGGLEAFVSDKQKLIDSIDELDRQFQAKYLRLKEIIGIKSIEDNSALGIPGIADLKSVIAKIMDIINNISNIENSNEKKAKTLLEQYSKEINKVSNGRKITSAYYPAPLNLPSYYIDRKK